MKKVKNGLKKFMNISLSINGMTYSFDIDKQGALDVLVMLATLHARKIDQAAKSDDMHEATDLVRHCGDLSGCAKALNVGVEENFS